jgi:hypothetical protein
MDRTPSKRLTAMVKRQTWILLALFLALAGFAIYLKYNPQAPAPDKNATPTATTAPVEFLFSAQEGVVTSILIESREGESIGVKRAGNAWMVTRPFEAAAEPTSVEAAASQVTALTVLARLDLDPAAAGLKVPAYTITIGFSSGKSFIAQIGDETPTGTGYYVRKEDGSVLVISRDGIDALLGLLLYPPFLETPTPSPIPPTETPTPSAASETPTVTKTP